MYLALLKLIKEDGAIIHLLKTSTCAPIAAHTYYPLSEMQFMLLYPVSKQLDEQAFRVEADNPDKHDSNAEIVAANVKHSCWPKVALFWTQLKQELHWVLLPK